ncbi:MAG: hypothetical protein D8M59_07470 [Planctomycetes bacterium]|nr:hypothetical protein [Planctomycetota bacterium]NOG53878.1 hypothetical protein [Planctomycetota bacterium]
MADLPRRRKAASDHLEATHTPEEVTRRLERGPGQSYLGDFIYGAIDGTVTTFAVVSGVAGAGLGAGIIIILGAANIIGDGFSMAASNYLGTKAERQLRDRTIQDEHHHIEHVPEGEREEIRQIFAAKGFAGDDLESAVNIITSDVERWVDTMLQEEHGLPGAMRIPWKCALATFVAFCFAGFVPLMPFVLGLILKRAIPYQYAISAGLTAITFVLIGAVKGRIVRHRWYTSAVETLFIGGAAAGLAFLAGVLLKGVVNVL